MKVVAEARCQTGVLLCKLVDLDGQLVAEHACEKCARLLGKAVRRLAGRRVMVLHYTAIDTGDTVATRVIVDPVPGSKEPDRGGLPIDPSVLDAIQRA